MQVVYKFTAVALILLVSAGLSGCVYHTETIKPDGTLDKVHIGFPEFSEGKEINLIKVN